MTHAEIGCNLVFKCFDVWTHDKNATRKTRAIASSISGLSASYWAVRSSIGIIGAPLRMEFSDLAQVLPQVAQRLSDLKTQYRTAFACKAMKRAGFPYTTARGCTSLCHDRTRTHESEFSPIV